MGQAHPRHCLNPAATSFAERPAHRPSTPQKRAAAGEENKTAEWLQAKGVLPPWFEQRESGGAQGWLALPEQSQPRWCVLDPLGTLSIFGGSGGGSGGGGGGVAQQELSVRGATHARACPSELQTGSSAPPGQLARSLLVQSTGEPYYNRAEGGSVVGRELQRSMVLVAPTLAGKVGWLRALRAFGDGGGSTPRPERTPALEGAPPSYGQLLARHRGEVLEGSLSHDSATDPMEQMCHEQLEAAVTIEAGSGPAQRQLTFCLPRGDRPAPWLGVTLTRTVPSTVTDVIPGGLAWGKLHTGDMLLRVNEDDVGDSDDRKSKQLIDAAMGDVYLTVLRKTEAWRQLAKGIALAADGHRGESLSRFEQALKDAGFEAKVWVHTRAERETRAHTRKQDAAECTPCMPPSPHDTHPMILTHPPSHALQEPPVRTLDLASLLALYEIGKLKCEEQEHEAAMRSLQLAMWVAPNECLSPLTGGIAWCLWKLGRFVDAEQLYWEVLHEEPLNARILVERAWMFVERAMWAEAIADLQLARCVSASSGASPQGGAETPDAKGGALRGAGQDGGGGATDGATAELLNLTGVCLYQLGDYKAALADFSAALRLEPRFAQACTNRANCHRKLGMQIEAKGDYLRAVELDASERALLQSEAMSMRSAAAEEGVELLKRGAVATSVGKSRLSGRDAQLRLSSDERRLSWAGGADGVALADVREIVVADTAHRSLSLLLATADPGGGGVRAEFLFEHEEEFGLSIAALRALLEEEQSGERRDEFAPVDADGQVDWSSYRSSMLVNKHLPFRPGDDVSPRKQPLIRLLVCGAPPPSPQATPQPSALGPLPARLRRLAPLSPFPHSEEGNGLSHHISAEKEMLRDSDLRV
jgi:tetratricopeptide (TPR) repeat protein